MENETFQKIPSIGTKDTPNSTIDVVQSRRQMKFYTVHENEMNNLAHYGKQVNFFNATGAFFSSFFISCLLDGLRSNFSHTLITLLVIFFIISFGCFYNAHIIQKTSNETINVIKEESSK